MGAKNGRRKYGFLPYFFCHTFLVARPIFIPYGGALNGTAKHGRAYNYSGDEKEIFNEWRYAAEILSSNKGIAVILIYSDHIVSFYTLFSISFFKNR